MGDAFYFILKTLFVLKLFKFLTWLFGQLHETASVERSGHFQNLWCLIRLRKCYNTHYPIFHEVKAPRKWNLVR